MRGVPGEVNLRWVELVLGHSRTSYALSIAFGSLFAQGFSRLDQRNTVRMRNQAPDGAPQPCGSMQTQKTRGERKGEISVRKTQCLYAYSLVHVHGERDAESPRARAGNCTH